MRTSSVLSAIVWMSALLLGEALSLVGCGWGEPGAAFVLLDRPAREAGLELRVAGRPVVATLPVEVSDAPTRVEVWAGGRVVSVDLEAGVLVWLRGSQAAMDRRVVGADIRTDAVMVTGEEGFVRGLASALGGRPALRPGGAGKTWIIEGPDVWERSAWMNAPSDVLESEPVALLPSEATDPATSKSSVAASLALTRRLKGPRTAGIREVPWSRDPLSETDADADALRPAGDTGMPSLVGMYASPAHTLLLDAEGSFRLEGLCGATVQVGRYRLNGDRLALDGDALALTFAVADGGRLRAEGGHEDFSAGGQP